MYFNTKNTLKNYRNITPNRPLLSFAIASSLVPQAPSFLRNFGNSRSNKMDSAWAPQDGEEWELRHDDDGFTYKILKRQRLTDPSEAVSQLPLADPKAEAKRRRERKRNTLLKLKNQYQSEIHKWEVLSNTLRSMQEKNEEVNQAASHLGSSNSSVVKKSEDSSGSLVDEFLLQAETQEAIISDISNLCDVAEAMCDAQQEQLVQSFIDLPVWSSPRELMKSLCDD